MVRFRESCQWCYQGINITWWGHELDPHWREKELKTLSPWSVPTDGEGGRLACIQSQAVVTSWRGGDSCPVSVRLTHCALIKRIPGVENSWSGCSTCLSLAPRKEQWAFSSSQVVAEAGKKQETHICSRAHSDLNSQCSVSLSFLMLQIPPLEGTSWQYYYPTSIFVLFALLTWPKTLNKSPVSQNKLEPLYPSSFRFQRPIS